MKNRIQKKNYFPLDSFPAICITQNNSVVSVTSTKAIQQFVDVKNEEQRSSDSSLWNI